jgi:Zn-dependent alcohol dehydrogenase
MNLFGEQDVFKSEDGQSPIAAKFFGHSSFANLSVVKETTVLPVKDLIKGEDELKLFAPLGCGIQTGVGAILNLVKPGPEDRVMVCGLGGVGLSAVMVSSRRCLVHCWITANGRSQGAHIAGCKQIIAVDRVQERIDLARSVFGATHGLNTSGLTDVTAAMKDVAGGRGPTVVIESESITSQRCPQ